jgi:hypothetical protein
VSPPLRDVVENRDEVLARFSRTRYASMVEAALA